MLYTRKAFGSDERISMEINCTPEQLCAWLAGEDLIQNCMPDATPEQREFCITGITPEEWDKMFPPEDNTWKGQS